MAPLRFDRYSDEPALRVSFIPLIDIVLQIICFYIFVSAGVQSNQDDTVQLPTMTAQPMKDEQPAAYTVNVLEDGSVALNGELVNPEVLEARMRAGQSAAAATGDTFSVAIRADKRQQFALLDRVLRTCRDAHVDKVYIRALSEADSAPVEASR